MALALRIAQAISHIDKHAQRFTEMAAHDQVTLGIYGRLVSVFHGVLDLARSGRPQEALILVRSMIEDDFRLRQLLEAGDDRDQYAIGYVSRSDASLIGVIRAAQAAGIERSGAAVLETLQARTSEYDAYLTRRGKQGTRRFLDEKAYAQKSGRAADYMDFLFLHHMVHGTDAALGFGRDTTVAGFVKITPIDDHELACAAALMAAEYALDGCEATATMFGWPAGMAFDQLRGEIESAARPDRQRRSTSSNANYDEREDGTKSI